MPLVIMRRSQVLSSALVAALLTLVPAVIGLASGQLLLFPSLGPTALMLAHSPEHQHARFHNVVVSHIVGMLVAYAVIVALGLAHAPSVFELRTLTISRVAAAAAAILVATAIELALGATHPPAASTTLLVALGSFKLGWQDAAWIAC